jgi:SAM-dependent methyltransferase
VGLPRNSCHILTYRHGPVPRAKLPPTQPGLPRSGRHDSHRGWVITQSTQAQTSTFDEVAPSYQRVLDQNLGTIGERAENFLAHKAETLARFWSEMGLPANGRILDLGCGIGSILPHLETRLPRAQYVGVDPSSIAIQIAKGAHAGHAHRFVEYDGAQLPFPDGGFDVVFAANVLHHVRPTDRAALYAEARRVLGTQGYFVAFEHNPWNPITRLLVRTCPFDDDAILLRSGELSKSVEAAGFQVTHQEYVLFLPTFLRRTIPRIERLLTWCPLGAQYWTASRRVED